MIASDALQTVIQTGVQTVCKPASNPIQTGLHTHPYNPRGSEGGLRPLGPDLWLFARIVLNAISVRFLKQDL